MGDMQYCVLLKLIKYPTSLPFLTSIFRASIIESKVATIEKSSTMVEMIPPSFETISCTSATNGLTVKSYSQDVSTAPGPRPSSILLII